MRRVRIIRHWKRASPVHGRAGRTSCALPAPRLGLARRRRILRLFRPLCRHRQREYPRCFASALASQGKSVRVTRRPMECQAPPFSLPREGSGMTHRQQKTAEIHAALVYPSIAGIFKVPPTPRRRFLGGLTVGRCVTCVGIGYILNAYTLMHWVINRNFYWSLSL